MKTLSKEETEKQINWVKTHTPSSNGRQKDMIERNTFNGRWIDWSKETHTKEGYYLPTEDEIVELCEELGLGKYTP